MSPPIREGSGSSIGSIRLGDGSEISEVRTGAGDVLFSAGPNIPDSGLLHYFNISESASTTSVDDLQGSMNLTGNASSIEPDDIDGHDILRFDGVDDLMDASRTGLSPPYDIWMVARVRTVTGSDKIQELINPSDSNVFATIADRRSTFSLFTPSDNDSGVSSDTNYHLFRVSVRSSERELFIDGLSAINVTGLSSVDFDGLTVGARASDGTSNAELDLSEAAAYDVSDSRYSVSDIKSYFGGEYPSLTIT
jgi:hypothetical protein